MNIPAISKKLFLLSFAIVLQSCSSGNSGGGNEDTTPPPPPPNVVISTAGGNGGDAGSGGNGSQINLRKFIGSGAVEVRKEGTVDANFTPFMPTPNLGSTPAIVSVNTTVSVLATEPAAGILYFQNTDSGLYLSDGDNDAFEAEERVTGLHIAQDVILTLDLNEGDGAAIALNNDLYNQGTIATVDESPSDRAGLSVFVSSYFANSEIDTSGRIEGQNGGHVNIQANFSIINHGNINSSGADNSNGAAGRAGSITLSVDRFSIENTGNLDASGGNSTINDAGNGNSIELNAPFGIRNSGNLLTRGGDGISHAGAGRTISINSHAAGDILNSGNIDARGGLATQTDGGEGGAVNINTRGGKLLSSGDIITRGGDTQQSSGSATAGQGASINININGSGHSSSGFPVNSGDLQLSGNLDSSGGNAPVTGDGEGGGAGSIFITSDASCCDFFDAAQKLSLLGYDIIDSSGGNGQTGGNGRDIIIQNIADSRGPDGDIPSGNIINEANLNSSGGDVSASSVGSYNGGCHGEVTFDTGTSAINQNSPEGTAINNSGSITARRGENLETNVLNICSSTGVFFQASTGIINTGNIDTSGGNDRGTDGGSTGRGTPSSSIRMQVVNGPISNTGTLSSKGGDGEYIGGNADFLEMHATTIDNSGDINLAGGNANAALSASEGGNGGELNLSGSAGIGSVTNTATVIISGGTGETPGDIGQRIEGGFCIAGNC